MSTLNAAAWFTERKKYNFKEVSIDGVSFNLIQLTDDLIEMVKDCETYESMLDLSAELGLSAGRKRIFDDAEMSADMDEFWLLPALNAHEDSSTRKQAGLEVCKISGLNEFLQDTLQSELEAEEAEKARLKAKALEASGVLDGDSETLGANGVTMGELDADADADAYSAINQ